MVLLSSYWGNILLVLLNFARCENHRKATATLKENENDNPKQYLEARGQHIDEI